MKNDYKTLKDFWNKSLAIKDTAVINSNNFNEPSYVRVLKKYLRNCKNILDYGCGSGWASFDLSFILPNSFITGLDQSANAIDYCNRCKEASRIKNVTFEICEDLNEYNCQFKFDGAISINLIDVLPDNVIFMIFESLQKTIKKDGIILFGINPDYPMDFLKQINFEQKNKNLYKDDVFRCNLKSTNEWIELLSKYFHIIESTTFSLLERERTYPRRLFVVKNNKL